MGEKSQMRDIVAKFSLFSKIQTISQTVGLPSDFKQIFLVKNNLVTSVHNEADAADDNDDYNRVIGMALLKAFSCAKKSRNGELFHSTR